MKSYPLFLYPSLKNKEVGKISWSSQGGLPFLGTNDNTTYPVLLARSSSNTSGYRLVSQMTCAEGGGSLGNLICIVSSRHQGSGLLSIHLNEGADRSAVSCDIRLFTATAQSIYSNAWMITYDKSTGVAKLWWYYDDYSETALATIDRVGWSLPSSTGTWQTTKPTGTQVWNVVVNGAEKLTTTTNAGNSTQPVYFSNGLPVAATAYSNAITQGLKVDDSRNDNPAPNSASFTKQALTVDFKYNDKIGSPTGFSGDYCGVLSLAPWREAPGGNGYQIAVGYNSNAHPRLAIRSADLSATSWGTWYKIYTSDDKPTPAEIGAATSEHTHSNYLTTSGTAAAATKLATARTIALSGDVTGSTSFNGTANVTITATVANDSHSHSDSTITSVGASKITGTLPVAHGGTGVTSLVGSSGLLGKLHTTPSNSDSSVSAYICSFSSDWAKGGYIPLNNLRSLIGAAASSHTHSYLPLSGGTMNANATVQRPGSSTSWVTGRNLALLKTNSSGGDSAYSCLWSCKTINGSWDLGSYTNDILHLSYITDVNYNAGTNAQTTDIQFRTDGTIRANTFFGTATKATLLATGRTIRTNLGSTSAATFTGGENITPGVTGTLPVANGGTGATARGGCHTSSGLLYKIGIQAGKEAAPSSGNAGAIYIQYT